MRVAPSFDTNSLRATAVIGRLLWRIGARLLAPLASLRLAGFCRLDGAAEIRPSESMVVTTRTNPCRTSEHRSFDNPIGIVSRSRTQCRGILYRSSCRLADAHNHSSLAGWMSDTCRDVGVVVQIANDRISREYCAGWHAVARIGECHFKCTIFAATLPYERRNNIDNRADRAPATLPSPSLCCRRRIISDDALVRISSIAILISTGDRLTEPLDGVAYAIQDCGRLPLRWREAAPARTVARSLRLYIEATRYQRHLRTVLNRSDDTIAAPRSARAFVMPYSGEKTKKEEPLPAPDRWVACRYWERKWVSRMGPVTKPRSLGGEPSRLAEREV